MRQYRGKDNNGVWRYGDIVRGVRTYIATKENKENMVVSLNYNACLILIEVDPDTVGQEWNNGFYEGDYMQAKLREGNVNVAGVIVFEDGEYLIEQKDDNFPLCSLGIVDHMTIEKLGNVIDNPELMEA